MRLPQPSRWSAQILPPQHLARASVGSVGRAQSLAGPELSWWGARLPSRAQTTGQSWTGAGVCLRDSGAAHRCEGVSGAPLCDCPWGELEAGMEGVPSPREPPSPVARPGRLGLHAGVGARRPSGEARSACVSEGRARLRTVCVRSVSLSPSGRAVRLPREPALLFSVQGRVRFLCETPE